MKSKKYQKKYQKRKYTKKFNKKKYNKKNSAKYKAGIKLFGNKKIKMINVSSKSKKFSNNYNDTINEYKNVVNEAFDMLNECHKNKEILENELKKAAIIINKNKNLTLKSRNNSLQTLSGPNITKESSIKKLENIKEKVKNFQKEFYKSSK